MLHGEIKVNGMTIGEWSATRDSHMGEDPSPDERVTYRCMVRQDSTLEGNPAVLERFTLQHRFGDGALALAALVIRRGLTNAQSRP